MATLFRKPRSPFWWTAYFDGAGKRRFVSTKRTTKSEATAVGAEMQNRARKISPGDDEKRQRILRLLENAAGQALRGTLSATSAQTILNQILEVSTGEPLQNASIADWLKGWAAEKKGSKAGGTSERYSGVVESFLKFLSPKKATQPLASLSVADVRAFRDKLVHEGRAATTANIAVKILRIPLNLARRQGLIQSNPAEAIDMISAEVAEKQIFTPEDIAKLVAVADENWKGLILAGYYTGARLGDLVGLQWKNVDLTRLSVAFGQRKTKRFVEIPLHPQLQEWMEKQNSRQPDDRVFPVSGKSKIGGAHGLSERFKALLTRAKIVGSVILKRGEKGKSRASLSFHSLRHSFNSAMANAGVTQEMRQRLTGHASKAVNDRYTHPELDTLRKAVESVPSLP